MVLRIALEHQTTKIPDFGKEATAKTSVFRKMLIFFAMTYRYGCL
jgi:hypothetical protein